MGKRGIFADAAEAVADKQSCTSCCRRCDMRVDGGLIMDVKKRDIFTDAVICALGM